MPHIWVLFPENTQVRAFLREYKTRIREIVSTYSGYRVEEIALIPQQIPHENEDISDNVLPLQFNIDGGKVVRTGPDAERVAKAIARAISKIDPFVTEIRFGVWYRSLMINGYAECNSAPPPDAE